MHAIEYLEKMRKIYIHIKCWNKWRKRNHNNRVYKFLVLINLRIPPTLERDKFFYGAAEAFSDFSKNIKEGSKNISKLSEKLRCDKNA